MKHGHQEKFGNFFTEKVQLENVRITEFNGRIFPIQHSPQVGLYMLIKSNLVF